MVQLPPAGKPTYIDSQHLDYRLLNARSPQSTTKLQSCEWFAPPTLPRPWQAFQEYYNDTTPQAEYVPSKRQKIPRNKPDFFYISDIEGSRPQTMPCSRSQEKQWRSVNPLEPQYDWPKENSRVTIYPQRQDRPLQRERMGEFVTGFEVDDLDEARPAPACRTRKDSWYTVYDYSDVPGTFSQPKYHKILNRQKDPRNPVDIRRLTFWGKTGDTGRMRLSQRVPTNPLVPTYQLHGETLEPEERKVLQTGRWLIDPAEWNKKKPTNNRFQNLKTGVSFRKSTKQVWR